VDPSVIHRLCAEPARHDELELYRPRNLLEYLATRGDLDHYVRGIGLDPARISWPVDVLEMIEKLKS
jgi:hypothetical protein